MSQRKKLDEYNQAFVAKLRAGSKHTDAELAELLPTLPLEERIGVVIAKYIGGAISRNYDGETAADLAGARIGAYLFRKLWPWLSPEPTQPPASTPPATGDES